MYQEQAKRARSLEYHDLEGSLDFEQHGQVVLMVNTFKLCMPIVKD
jgi:hypothetical protein